MVSRSLSLAALAIALLISIMESAAQETVSHLLAGDSLPLLTGHSLSGDAVELPSEARGRRAVILFSFSREGGQRAKDWIQHLSLEIPGVSIYSVVFLETVPGPFRGVVASGIKSRTPQQQQGRTLLVYTKTNAWKQQLQSCDLEDVCVLLLKPDSHIGWMTGGSFSANRDQALRSQLSFVGHE